MQNFEIESPLCIYTIYISLESLGVVGQCLRGCGALQRCRYHGLINFQCSKNLDQY